MTGELPPLETLKKRILYNCNHRGSKEADLILGQFAKKHLKSFTEEDLKLFEHFLDQSDEEILHSLKSDLEGAYAQSPLLQQLKAYLASYC